MKATRVPKNTEVDFLCNLASGLVGDAGPDWQRRVVELRRALKAALTAHRKTLKPRRRT